MTNCNYDLLVEAYEVGKTLRVALRYDVALFAEASIERHGKAVDRAVAQSSGEPESEPGGADGDRRKRSGSRCWSGIGRSAEYPERSSVQELFEEQVRQAPEAVAVVYQGERR